MSKLKSYLVKYSDKAAYKAADNDTQWLILCDGRVKLKRPPFILRAGSLVKAVVSLYTGMNRVSTKDFPLKVHSLEDPRDKLRSEKYYKDEVGLPVYSITGASIEDVVMVSAGTAQPEEKKSRKRIVKLEVM